MPECFSQHKLAVTIISYTCLNVFIINSNDFSVTLCMMVQAWKLEQERLKEEDMAKKSKKENTLKGKQQKEEAGLPDNKKSKTVSSGKSRAETAGSSAKTPTESISTTAPPVEENEELHPTEEPFNVRAHTQN